MKRLLMILPILSAALSCVSVELTPQIVEPQPVEVELISQVSQFSGKTKSVFGTDEDQVHDINLYVFDNTGSLVISRFENTFSKSLTISLVSSVEYTICALANWGEALSFPTLSSLNAFRLDASQFSRNGRMLMAARTTAIPVGTENIVYLDLKRAVAKVSLTLDSSALGHISVQSVRICQANGSIMPFSNNVSASSVVNGDHASSSDLLALAEGGSAVFYVPENIRGNLLPGNSDPWSKVPDSIGSSAGLCTYMEVVCNIQDVKTLYSGSVQYRFYLGNDNCSNFDVRRNTDYRITLVMTDNLDAVSWKIDADVSIATEGHGSGHIAAGLHDSVSTLYVGEIFSYEISADEALLNYFDGDLSRASITVIDRMGTETGSIRFNAMTNSSGKWVVRGTCQSQTVLEESIWIVDKAKSKKVQKLESGVIVRKPCLVCTQLSPSAGSPVTESNNLVLSVNGSAITRNVCMVDEDRRNLAGMWFDNTVFSGTVISMTFDQDFEALSECVSVNSQRSLKGASNFATLTCRSVYSGSPIQTGMRLCDGVGLSEAGIHVEVRENSKSINTSFPVTLRVRPVRLDYDCTTGLLSIDNPSKLPISMECCDFAWLGPQGWSTGMLSGPKGVEQTYSRSGAVYKAVRYDCVNSNGQCFAFNMGCAMSVTDGEYDLSQDLVDFRTAFAGLSSNSASFAVFDMTMIGTSGRIPFPDDMLSTTTGGFDPGAGSSWYHGGVVLFTDGRCTGGSEGVSPSASAKVAYACNGQACIYSPTVLNSLDGVTATMGESSTVSASANHAGSTENLEFTLNGGAPTVFEMTYRQIAAVRTMPNGYADSPFTIMRYKWKSPEITSIIQTEANPGDNAFSYLFNPGQPNQMEIVGTYGNSKFTTSNFVLDDSLAKTFVSTLEPGQTGTIPVLNFIDNRIFTLYEEDSASSMRSTPTYEHRYHPGDCSITGYAHTVNDDELYLCDFQPMFSGQMQYFNSMYDGFYSWMYRDLSAPVFPTPADTHSAGSNCDRYTTWYFKNKGDGFAASSDQTIRSGTCIRLVR